MSDYGYNDKKLVQRTPWDFRKSLSLLLAIILLSGAWLFLNYKLLFGTNWISETYDNEEWRTNEGNLHTFGAWDFETHVWKTEYILKYFPNFQWNPFWYLGMPLLEYYQTGFYAMHILFIFLFSLEPARAALLMIIFFHLIAVFLTFLLCYKVSGKIWASAFSSLFLLASTFITLRSYGWEPVSVVFLFLYPLGLLVFLKNPTKPFRFWMILILAISYVSHPLIFFSLAMTFGLYLFSIAIRPHNISKLNRNEHYIWKYLGAVLIALMIGGIQFIPMISYNQQTSGAHMGVSYIPFYHVPFNIISVKDFFFDAGNLKGPGLSIMVSFFLLLTFIFYEKKNSEFIEEKNKIFKNYIVSGFLFVLIVMVLFYYLERFNIFPMNLLRSIQYHRIIPEFIIASSVFTVALSNIIKNRWQKIAYYSILIGFALASFIVIYKVQDQWETTENISQKPEFIYDEFKGRISFPYTDQSLSVRNSFTEIPQAYGYYEQGITNAYADEIFSVSSGYHGKEISLIYLMATNVKRLYVNMEEGERDKIVFEKFNGTLDFNHDGGRYGYFEIPIANPEMAQAIDGAKSGELQEIMPKCRVLFKEAYCGSAKEEFVTLDIEEKKYLRKYVELLNEPYESDVLFKMENPERYSIIVSNAKNDTVVVVKMTYNDNFVAKVEDENVEIEKVGPDFILLKPETEGNYTISLEYKTSKRIIAGAFVSLIGILALILIFAMPKSQKNIQFKRGDMHE